MLPLVGRPFIDHKLDEAARVGADRVVLLLGHGADQIAEHVASRTDGPVIEIVVDGPELLGTGGALKRAVESLGDAPWVTYGDTLLDADLAAAERHAAALGCVGVMTVLHNADRWETSNTTIADGRVVAYTKGDPPGTHQHIDYGFVRVPTDALTAVDKAAFDLGVVLQRLIADRMLAAFEVSERFHDIGTPEALAETEAWLQAVGERPL
jgi:NDP-sugar pyrophosphorylase family protein